MAQNTIKLQTCTLKQTCTCIRPPSTHSHTEPGLAALARRRVSRLCIDKCICTVHKCIHNTQTHRTQNKPYGGMWAPQDNDTHTTITSQYSDLRPHVMINNEGSAQIYSSSSYRCIEQPSPTQRGACRIRTCGGLGWKDAGLPNMSLNQESHAASCKMFTENKMLKDEKSSS